MVPERKRYSYCFVAQSCPTLLQPHGLQPASLLYPWDFPGKILEGVAVSFSRGYSQPRDQTHISCRRQVKKNLAGGFFTTQPPRRQSTKSYIKRWGYIKPESFQGPKMDWSLYVNEVNDKMDYNRKNQINVQQSILL